MHDLIGAVVVFGGMWLLVRFQAYFLGALDLAYRLAVWYHRPKSPSSPQRRRSPPRASPR